MDASRSDPPTCGAQTYWYENGVQRAKWCPKPATHRTHAMDGSSTLGCDGHTKMMVEAGATAEPL